MSQCKIRLMQDYKCMLYFYATLTELTQQRQFGSNMANNWIIKPLTFSESEL